MSTATRGGETGETWTSLPPNFVEIANRRLRLCNLKQGPQCTMPQARWSGFNLTLNDRDLFVVLTFESTDKILRCGHSNEICLAELSFSHGSVYLVRSSNL